MPVVHPGKRKLVHARRHGLVGLGMQGVSGLHGGIFRDTVQLNLGIESCVLVLIIGIWPFAKPSKANKYDCQSAAQLI